MFLIVLLSMLSKKKYVLSSKPCNVLNFSAFKALCSYMVCSYKKRVLYIAIFE